MTAKARLEMERSVARMICDTLTGEDDSPPSWRMAIDDDTPTFSVVVAGEEFEVKVTMRRKVRAKGVSG